VLVFSLLVLVIFAFAFEPQNIPPVAAGVLWVAFTFGGMLGLGRSFVMEKEKGSLDGLLLTPVDRSVIYFGKMVANLIFMLIISAVVLLLFYILLNLPVLKIELFAIVVLASIGFSAVGTLFSALAVNTTSRDVMLPILFLPIVSPLIIFAVKGTELILQGQSWGSLTTSFELIAVFDVIYVVVSSFVFEFVIEE
jgi:heme exporter protein B